MKFFLSVLGILIVANSADACKEGGRVCLDDMIKAFKENSHGQVNCGKLNESVDCLQQYVERCTVGEKRKDSQGQLTKMRENVKIICFPQPKNDGEFDDSETTDEENQIIKCATDERKILNYIGECVEQSQENLFRRPWMIPNNLRDSTCKNYLDISRCTSKKVGESCGEQVEKPFFNGLMKDMENVEPNGAGSLKCVEVIKEAGEYFSSKHKHKRRFVRDISFAKLML